MKGDVDEDEHETLLKFHQVVVKEVNILSVFKVEMVMVVPQILEVEDHQVEVYQQLNCQDHSACADVYQIDCFSD